MINHSKEKKYRIARPGQAESMAPFSLTLSELNACAQFQANVDNLLRRLKRKYKLSNKELAILFDPYITDPSKVSHILSDNSNRRENRHFRLVGLPAIRYLFNESIDELIAFEHEPRPDFRRPPTNFS